MNIARLCTLVIIAITIVAGGSAADNSNVRNGAYWYDQALDAMHGLSAEQMDLIANYTGGEPSPELRNALRLAEPVISLIRRGAAQQYSDYGLDYSQGFDLMLPHLSEMRRAARLVNVQARVKMFDGDLAGASRDLASIYRLGGHMGDDRTLISALVGHAVFAYGDESVQYAIYHGELDSAAAAQLAQGVQQLDPNDPFGYVESIFTEQELITATLRTHVVEHGDPMRFAELLSGSDEQADAIAMQLAAADMDEELAGIDRVMNEVVEIFMLDDSDEAKQRLDMLETAIVDGQFGVFASKLMPAYSKVYERLIDARIMVAERRAMLEELARGELDPMSLANAAVLYQQAADAYAALPAEQRSLIDAFAARPANGIDEATSAALDAATSAIDLLRQGSLLRRCDFGPLRRNERMTIAATHTLWMHELLSLLHADATRLAHRGDGDAAADRIAVAYRVIGHLSRDDHLLSPLIAHGTFARVTELAGAGLSGGLFKAHREQLGNAVQHIARRDPFGYVNAVMNTRTIMVRELRHLAGDDDREALERLLSTWQGDELLFVMTVLETLEENAAQADAAEIDDHATSAHLAERLAPLDGIVAIRAVEQVQQNIGSVAPRLAMGEVDIVSDVAMPSIGNWNQRMRRARADLREVYQLLDLHAASGADEPAEQPINE